MVKTYTGNSRNNTKSARFFGKWHSWRMYGNGGSDTLTGGNKNDTIYGGGSSQWFDTDDTGDILDGGYGNDYLYGGLGNDTVIGGWDNDTVYGGLGNDRLDGNSHNDKLYGGSGNDTIDGGSGDDTLDGGSGNDVMRGGLGNDTYYVDSHLDRILENAPSRSRSSRGWTTATTHPGENDKVFVSARLNSYSLDDNVEHLTIHGRRSNATFEAFGNEADNYITNVSSNQKSSIDAGRGDDTLIGGSTSDTLSGGSGDDLLMGGTGYDYLRGDANNDTLVGVGGAGNSGAEVDLLRGGIGADQFYLFNPATGADYLGNPNSYAVIEDFSRFAGDTIHVEQATVGQYTLGHVNVRGGSELTDTAISFGGEVIAYVIGNTNVNLSDLRFESVGNQLEL